LVKVHPRQRPGGRWTDPDDLPVEKVGYAMRDLDRLVAAARRVGPDVGIYAERLLDDKLPWTRMRAVYRLLGLARRYGDHAVDTACGKALEVDVVSVQKIAAMLELATEHRPVEGLLRPARPNTPAAAAAARFARDPAEYATRRTARTSSTGRAPAQRGQLRLLTDTGSLEPGLQPSSEGGEAKR
jgi:hypothetical protein